MFSHWAPLPDEIRIIVFSVFKNCAPLKAGGHHTWFLDMEILVSRWGPDLRAAAQFSAWGFKSLFDGKTPMNHK